MKLIQTYLIYKGANELRFLYNNKRYLKNHKIFRNYGAIITLELEEWAKCHKYFKTPKRYIFNDINENNQTRIRRW